MKFVVISALLSASIIRSLQNVTPAAHAGWRCSLRLIGTGEKKEVSLIRETSVRLALPSVSG
jgi:hypothetical protein